MSFLCSYTQIKNKVYFRVFYPVCEYIIYQQLWTCITLLNWVTVTSNVTLHSGIICYNQLIELTCHASAINLTIYDKWTSSKSSQSEHSAGITVMAMEDSMQYTCMVSDSNGNCGTSIGHVNNYIQ